MGSRSAFTAAAVVSVASLATMLLGAVQKAYAGQCGGNPDCHNNYCCYYSEGDFYSCMPYDPEASYCTWMP
ncbi:hypothetical protein FJZ33_00340 [Candidatus Poribacteria bacterium]|nr:hypothetical protein [Candidatus Poribacteria bacterium]